MSEKQQKKWEKTRAKGFNRYIILIGLVCPVFMTISFILASYFFDEKINTREMFIRFILLLVGGFLFGWWSYERNERLYLKTAGKNE
jgi:hypothetical protein